METPADWPDAQRAFHLAYLDDPAQFLRRPVTVTWVTLRQRGGMVGLARTMWRLAGRRYEGVEVTVTESRPPRRCGSVSLMRRFRPGPEGQRR